MSRSLLSLFVLATAVHGDGVFGQPSDVIVLHGQCGAQSNIAEGMVGDDLRKRQRRFFCDAAIISADDLSGKILIQFADKASNHQAIIGFAGQFNRDQTIDIQRTYFEPDRATRVDVGMCRAFYKPGETRKNLDTATELFCFSKVDDNDSRTVAVIAFRIDQAR